jgi:hypothetical protein
MRYGPAWELQRSYHSYGRWRRQAAPARLSAADQQPRARARLPRSSHCYLGEGERVAHLDRLVADVQFRLRRGEPDRPQAGMVGASDVLRARPGVTA